MDVWKDLEPLRRNKHVGVEQITFGLLWQLCEGVPREIVVTAKRLSRDFNRDPAAFRQHLISLYRLGIVDLLDRDRRRGVYRVLVYRPLPAHATKKPDPQKVLPGFWDSDGDSETPSAIADLKPAEPKTPSPESAFLASEQGPRPLTGEGVFSDFRAEKSPRDGEISAPAEGQKCAEISPRGPSATRESAANIGRSPLPGVALEGAEISPRESVAPARPTNESVKRKRLLNGLNEQHGPNEFNEFKELNIPPIGAEKSPRDGEISAPVRRRRRDDSSHAGEPSFAVRALGETTAALAFVVKQQSAPGPAKNRLVADLRQLVADPFTGDWLYGFAADLMLVYGRSRHPYADQIHAAIHDLMQELRNLREVEKRKGLKPAPRGMRLNKVVHLTAETFGILTPKQQGRQKKSTVPGEERL